MINNFSKTNLRFFLKLFLLSICFSCYLISPPDWILNQPDDDDHWYGYGIVQKSFKGNIRDEARVRAIEEIASQISIDISSNFKTKITENNYSVNEYTEILTETRLNANLEHIEIVDTYRDKEGFTLLARLNRDTYYETIRRKRTNAVETALGYVSQADESFTIASFSLLEKADKTIADYLDRPIPVQYPKIGGKVQNLYPLIHLKISDYYNRISIETKPETIDAIIGFPVNKKISIIVKDKKTGKPIPGIPLYSKMLSDTMGIVVSNTDGSAEFNLSRIKDKQSLQSFDIIVNHNKIFQSSKFNNRIFSSIPVYANSPKISINSIEKNLKKNLETMPISESLKQVFQGMYGAEFVDSDGDLHIELMVSTEKKSKNKNEYGLFIAFGNLSINIKTRNGEEIFSMAMTGEMGRSFSNHRVAGLEAIEELNKKMMKKLKIDLDSVFGN